MTVRTRVQHLLDTEDRELQLRFNPSGDPLVQKVGDKTVVGYLVRDEDCEHPLENSDGMGKIHRWYEGSRESREAFYDATGYNEHGEKVAKPAPFALWLDVYDHSGEWWSLAHSGYECRWDTSHNVGVWVPDDCCLEHIRSEALKRLLPEGCSVYYHNEHGPDGKCITRPPKEGEKPYFSDGTCIDERYHNVITYKLPDGTTKGGYKSFVTATRAAAKALGVKVDKEALKAKQWEVARECATQALESYNAWNTGDCYGVCVEVFDGNGDLLEDDACWGYVGEPHATDSLKNEIEGMVKRLQDSK